jgi:hypothetical protein
VAVDLKQSKLKWVKAFPFGDQEFLAGADLTNLRFLTENVLASIFYTMDKIGTKSKNYKFFIMNKILIFDGS